jgi:hypothetical protein
MAGSAAAAVALVTAGWAVGRSAYHPAAGGGADRPAASASARPAQSAPPGQVSPSGQALPRAKLVLGPVLPPPGVQAGGSPPPGGAQGQPPLLPGEKPGEPYIALSQDTGDSNTGFVVRGQSWPVGKPLTIELVGVRTSPVHPVADDQGTFNYPINQDHEFFRAGIPPGTYTVRVSAAGGAFALATFSVQQPG